ncbi:MAG: hypothetical protein KIT14_06990 [bacterium]|nr:hypothetical protein [bacterium]
MAKHGQSTNRFSRRLGRLVAQPPAAAIRGAEQDALDAAPGHAVGRRFMLDFRVTFALDHLDADEVDPLADALRAAARGMGPVISSRVGGGPANVTTSLLALDAALAIDDARRVLHEALTALRSSPRVRLGRPRSRRCSTRWMRA